MTGTEPGGRYRPAGPARGASWTDDVRSGSRVHCCGAATYMDAARGGVRAGRRVGQSAWRLVRTAWRAPAGGRRRGSGALSAGPGGGRRGWLPQLPRGCPRSCTRRCTRPFRAWSECSACSGPLSRRRRGCRQPLCPPPSLAVPGGRGRCGVGGRQGARGPALISASGGPWPGGWPPLVASAGGRGPGRAVGGSDDHGQPPQHDRRRGGVR